jgi:radical SAM protein with 4Fe4S-binding SPASM domain
MNTGIVKRKKTFIKKSLFTEIVNKYADCMTIVGLSHHGEALLHPDLLFFINYLHKNGVKALITTNATLLTKDMSMKLLKSDLDNIMFSFDSTKKEIYENIRVGAKFEKTFENIKTFLELKNKLKKSTHVCIRTINMDSTKNHMQEFISYFEKIKGVNEIEVNEINTWGGRIKRENFNRIQSIGIRKNIFCLQPWTTIIINSDGGIFVCNNHEDGDFGNLKEHTLLEIWNNKKYQNLRKRILQPNPKNTICENCDYESMGMYIEKPNRFFPVTNDFFKYFLKHLHSLFYKNVKTKRF